MSEIVGINLGTANSSISVFKDGKAMVIPNNEGYIRIPSVVSLNDNDIIVGSLAKRQLLIHPENTHSLLNYYLNQGFNIKDLLIKNLIANASSYLNKAIHEIVLSLPCIDMNNDYKDICNELNIKINKIITHNEAIALTYQSHHYNELVMIIHLDEVFTNISIFDIEKKSIEKLSDIISDLKGYDFSLCLANYLIECFYNEHHKDLRQDQIAITRILEESKKIKKELSSSFSARVLIPFIQTDEYGPLNLDYVVTRNQFNHLCFKYLEKFESLIYQALNEARLLPGEIDKIVLIGGSSRMNMIQEKIKEVVGQSPSYVYNNIESIAIGCALAANKDIEIKDYIAK